MNPMRSWIHAPVWMFVKNTRKIVGIDNDNDRKYG
jgi:hypothetical protein